MASLEHDKSYKWYKINIPGTALLSGAGILHRGGRGYGGFIAPQAITFNYEQYITPDPLSDDV